VYVTNYRTTTTPLSATIPSGHPDIQFLRIVEITSPASPLAIVQYALAGQEQARGFRLDLDKFAFLDHYADDLEIERSAARAIVSYLASRRPGIASVQSASGD